MWEDEWKVHLPETTQAHGDLNVMRGFDHQDLSAPCGSSSLRRARQRDRKTEKRAHTNTWISSQSDDGSFWNNPARWSIRLLLTNS
ncbi:hypothetical protein AOLI_G00183270 [Acnodon oligacanthus]